jgi:hypothetical protein
MNTSKSLLLACVLGSLGAGKLSAQIIDYSITGTFGSSVPSTLVSAPNATYDIQFSLPAQQPPNPDTNAFGVHFTDESYALNGQTIFSGQSSRALFGMGILTPTDTLDVYLPAPYNDGFFLDGLERLFSGAVSNPTLIPASLDFQGGLFGIPNGSGYTSYVLPNTHVEATVAVPELSSMSMFSICLFSCAGLAILRNRRRMVAIDKAFQPAVQKLH